MAVLKMKDAQNMRPEEKLAKMKELQIMLMKKTAPSGKGGKVKNKEIRKAIARILTAIHKEEKK